ncbi:MAG: putative molybdenum carrier protein [Bacteroidales bacterium]|nr:putative molybdenum carrier protein [Bacteroidales bacterium]
MIEKIISGGQTGADRAALDFAIKHNIPHGGWIPKGRKTEAGILPEKYHLQEMPTGSYPRRTEKNVLDSDGTLIVSHGLLTGGSALTTSYAEKHKKPWIHIDLEMTTCSEAVKMIQEWVERNGIKTMNVAGPRESKDPTIYLAVMELLEATVGG